MSEVSKVTILGAGSWGTALAKTTYEATLTQEKPYQITLWDRNSQRALDTAQTLCNTAYLPDVALPADLKITADLKQALQGADIVLLVVPSQALRALLRQIKDLTIEYEPNCLWVSAIKGIELESLMFMHAVIQDELGAVPVAVLSGPTHAEEVARQIPSSLVAAALEEKHAQTIQSILSTSYLRVYTNSDMMGAQLGGAVKNAIALAVGISDGLGLGANSKAALITRGLAEIVELGCALGCREKTFYGLTGLGDLITTSTSPHSRNRFVGEQIGRGRHLTDILRDMMMVAEGLNTLKCVDQLKQRHGVEMPICEQTHCVIFEDKDPRQAVHDLMTRRYRSEWN